MAEVILKNNIPRETRSRIIAHDYCIGFGNPTPVSPEAFLIVADLVMLVSVVASGGLSAIGAVGAAFATGAGLATAAGRRRGYRQTYYQHQI